MSYRLLFLCGFGIMSALPGAAAAQGGDLAQSAWITDARVAATNVLTGAVTAAVTAAIRGNDVSEAFLKGAVGGSLVFLGKRAAVGRFSGAGLLGRQVASLGTSVVVNGGNGKGWVSEVWLPLGPTWVQVRPGARVRARVNLADLGTLIWAATRPELHFDFGRSISNGTAVFVAEDHRIVDRSHPHYGVTIGGVVAISTAGPDVDQIQGHENVHVIQHDYNLQTVSRPIEKWGWTWVTDREIPLDFVLIPQLAYPEFIRDLRESEADRLSIR